MSRSEEFHNPWGPHGQKYKTAGAAKRYITTVWNKQPDGDMWEHQVVPHPDGDGFSVQTRKSQAQLDFEKNHVPFWEK